MKAKACFKQPENACHGMVVISAERRSHLAFDLLKWESFASPRSLAVDTPCVSESDPERAALHKEFTLEHLWPRPGPPPALGSLTPPVLKS